MTVAKKKSSFLRNFSTIFAILILGLPIFVLAEIKDDSTPYPDNLYRQCFDGEDNDGDGFIDLRDIDCPKCFDGLDNDLDNYVDEADPDCPKNKQGFWRGAASAIFGLTDKVDEQNSPSGGYIKSGGITSSGGIISGSQSRKCLGRTVVFPRRVRTESGFIYVVDFVGCDNLIHTGKNIEPKDDFISTGGLVTAGGLTATGGKINSGGNIPSGGMIPSGGFVASSGTISAGGTIPSGSIIASGGVITGGPTIPAGGVIPGGGTI